LYTMSRIIVILSDIYSPPFTHFDKSIHQTFLPMSVGKEVELVEMMWSEINQFMLRRYSQLCDEEMVAALPTSTCEGEVITL